MTTDPPRTGCYIYGIAPAYVMLPPEGICRSGLGTPQIVREGDLAALVSIIDVSRPVGRAEDLIAHQELLDATARTVPVLPVRFGTVMSDPDAVAVELLDRNQESFGRALRRLQDRDEMIVTGRFVQSAVLAEVLSESPEIAQLRRELRRTAPTASHRLRVHLGRVVAAAVARKRACAERQAIERLRPLTVRLRRRLRSDDYEALSLALLVDRSQRAALEHELDELAKTWSGWIAPQLRGPVAAYDFVDWLVQSTPQRQDDQPLVTVL